MKLQKSIAAMKLARKCRSLAIAVIVCLSVVISRQSLSSLHLLEREASTRGEAAWWGFRGNGGRHSSNENTPGSRAILPLPDLTGSRRKVECPEGLVPVADTLGDPRLTFADRKIPRIVHLTAKSRCVTTEFAKNADKWRLEDHSLLFHDDEAVDALMNRHWPEFPHLQHAMQCLIYGGALKADVWRLLVLWEYGGIYADFDSQPGKFNATTITPADDSFFVVDPFDLSQWFMAASPRHPLIYFIILDILKALSELNDVGEIPVMFTTGPGMMRGGFYRFAGPERHRQYYNGSQHLEPGVYQGVDARTVTLAGTRPNWDEYIIRNVYMNEERLHRGQNHDNVKHDVYQTMGMNHWSKRSGLKRNESCYWRLWRSEMENPAIRSPSW